MNREFVCIKQFRPPLYFGASDLSKATIPKESMGFWFSSIVLFMCSYELCAGLMDVKERSKEQAIVDEIKEELGYVVPASSLEFISRSSCFEDGVSVAVGNVGLSGARGYMFYAEVTPEQKVVVKWWNHAVALPRRGIGV